MIELFKEEFNKEISGWSDIAVGVNGGAFVANNGCGLYTKGVAVPPLMIRDDGLAWEDYAVSAVVTNFSRVNLYLALTDLENNICVYTAGNGVFCAITKDGVFNNLGGSLGVSVAQGDTVTASVTVRNPFVIVEIFINGVYTFCWSISSNDVNAVGTIGVQFESQDESSVDSIVVNSLEGKRFI